MYQAGYWYNNLMHGFITETCQISPGTWVKEYYLGKKFGKCSGIMKTMNFNAYHDRDEKYLGA